MLDDRPYMREEYRRGFGGFEFRWPMWSILLVVNIVCFIAQSILEQAPGGVAINNRLALSGDGLAHWRIYELLTFQFMHGGLLHLAGNLIGLFFFGRAMEQILGGKSLLKLYLASGIFGGLAQVLFGLLLPQFSGPVVGASAGVFGLIAAFAISRPDQPITMLIFFILPVTFRAKYILVFEALLALLGMLDRHSNIAHAAHLGGMLTGILYILWISNAISLERFNLFRRRPRSTRVIITPPHSAWGGSNRPRPQFDNMPPAEFMSREVDPILEKISAHGIQSLTDEERQILEAARHRMVKR